MDEGGWQYLSLDKCLDKIIDYRGKSVPKAKNGVPLITARNIRKGKLSFSQKEYIPEGKYYEWMNRGIPMGGDLLFTTEAPVGMIASFPMEGKYALGQRTICLRTNEDICHNGFLLQFLLSQKGYEEVAKRTTGSTAKGIKVKELKKILIPIPLIQEQQKIAEILSTWDNAIELVGKQIEAKKRLKKGLMQQLLSGKMRFPGFEGKWEVKKLLNIAKINTNSLSQYTLEDYKFLYISLSDVKEGVINFPKTKISFDNSPSRARRKFKRGDILMSTVRPNLKGFAYVDFESTEFICSTGFSVIHPDKNLVNPKFVYLNLFSFQTEKYIDSCVVGSNYPALNNGDVRNMKFSLPSIEEQNLIVQSLSNINFQIRKMNELIKKYKKQKQGLMQKLLTGEVRVKV